MKNRYNMRNFALISKGMYKKQHVILYQWLQNKIFTDRFSLRSHFSSSNPYFSCVSHAHLMICSSSLTSFGCINPAILSEYDCNLLHTSYIEKWAFMCESPWWPDANLRFSFNVWDGGHLSLYSSSYGGPEVQILELTTWKETSSTQKNKQWKPVMVGGCCLSHVWFLIGCWQFNVHIALCASYWPFPAFTVYFSHSLQEWDMGYLSNFQKQYSQVFVCTAPKRIIIQDFGFFFCL